MAIAAPIRGSGGGIGMCGAPTTVRTGTSAEGERTTMAPTALPPAAATPFGCSAVRRSRPPTAARGSESATASRHSPRNVSRSNMLGLLVDGLELPDPDQQHYHSHHRDDEQLQCGRYPPAAPGEPGV